MKCLTLTQPWATLVAIGAKKMETRSWRTDYTGPLAIHAGKAFPEAARALVREPIFANALREAPTESPGDIIRRLEDARGKVIATVTLLNCSPVEVFEAVDAFGRVVDAILGTKPRLSEQERAFGDFSPGRFAWMLGRDAKLIFPQAARGSLGLWDWTPPAGVLA